MEQINLCDDLIVEIYNGLELSKLSDVKLLQVARCYRDIFNESWGEKWTEQSALEIIKKALVFSEDRVPIGSFLIESGEVVGFSWGILVQDPKNLILEDMPYELSVADKKRGLENTQYWITRIMGTKKLFIYKELGVVKRLRGMRAPALSLALFERAFAQGHKVGFLWTNPESASYRWSLGTAWTPICLFAGNDLVILAGLTKTSADIARGIVDGPSKTSLAPIIENRRRYFGK